MNKIALITWKMYKFLDCMCERVIQMANKLVIFTDATFQPPSPDETVQIARKRLVKFVHPM